MGTLKKRHTCINCGSKRVIDKMVVAYTPRFGRPKYKCNINNLPLGVLVSVYCSKRTP